MPVARQVTVMLPVSGPGVGQRDSWQTGVALKLERDGTVRVEKSPGMSGSVARVKLSDLAEAVDLLQQEEEARD